MIKKMINLPVNQDKKLKKIANNLGISEEELIENLLSQFLTENIVINDPLEDFLGEAEKISQHHKLPKGYKFNRQELYKN